MKLRVHDSLFVPLAKWSMLLAGNYRCVQGRNAHRAGSGAFGYRTSRSVYNFVFDLCVKLGARPEDLVPFEKSRRRRAVAARPARPRALQNGVPNIDAPTSWRDREAEGLAIRRSTRRSLAGRSAARAEPQEAAAWLLHRLRSPSFQCFALEGRQAAAECRLRRGVGASTPAA